MGLSYCLILFGGLKGYFIVRAVRDEIGRALPILIISGTEMRIRDARDPFLKYLRKPVDLDVLLKTIEKLA